MRGIGTLFVRGSPNLSRIIQTFRIGERRESCGGASWWSSEVYGFAEKKPQKTCGTAGNEASYTILLYGGGKIPSPAQPHRTRQGVHSCRERNSFFADFSLLPKNVPSYTALLLPLNLLKKIGRTFVRKPHGTGGIPVNTTDIE